MLGVCHKADHSQNLLSRAPTREAYVVQVKGAAQIYGAKAAKVRAQIDNVLKTATGDRDGSNLGALFVTIKAGSAAIYATTWSALRNPDDPLVANNLGMLMKGMKDYPRALQALLYADGLKPNMPVTITNLAWTYYDLGDTVKAQELFQKAVELNPKLSSPHMGLGLLAECNSDYKTAAMDLRQSLDNGFSPLAATALDIADTEAANAGNQDNGQRPITIEKPNPNKSPPAEKEPAIPDPPVSGQVAEMVAAQQALGKMYSETMQQNISMKKEIIAETPAYKEASKHSGATILISDNSAIVYRDAEMEEFLMHDLFRILIKEKVKPAYEEFHTAASDVSEHFENRSQTIIDQFEQEASACGKNNACLQKAEYKVCVQRKELAESSNPEFFGAWDTYWTVVKPALVDYYGFTNSTLANIRNPERNKFMNLVRNEYVLDEYTRALIWPMSWAALMTGAWRPECTPPPEESKPPLNLKLWPQEAECKIPPLFFGIPAFSVEADCEKFKIEFGEGIIGYVESDWLFQDVHIFVGVGIEAKVGLSVEPLELTALKAEAKDGVRFDFNNGELKNMAIESSLEGQIAGVKGEIKGDISLEGGPSLEHEVRVGGAIE